MSDKNVIAITAKAHHLNPRMEEGECLIGPFYLIFDADKAPFSV
jgi:hypothetical protein